MKPLLLLFTCFVIGTLGKIPTDDRGVPTSNANVWEVTTQHLHIDLYANFATQTLIGHVDITAQLADSSVTKIILDTMNLAISSVVDLQTNQALNFELPTPQFPIYGQALVIHLNTDISVQNIRIYYQTSNTGDSAIQWLAKEQTKDKLLPFLFTQGEAIHIRSMLPCQDTPSIKAPYSANITIDNTGATVVMSAEPIGQVDLGNGQTVWMFEQKVPVQSYLIALGIGGLKYKAIGDPSGIPTGVWAEPSQLEVAAQSFADAQSFVTTVQEYTRVPYVWGSYNILVLPPSFPYGGMENPCMTFATPTIVDPDRSLESVILHEISHSWTGNLVTNRLWADFWLNEGFTMFLERTALKLVYGKPFADLDALIGVNTLQEEVTEYNSDNRTMLVPYYGPGADPDYFFSDVPYEKGFNLLFYLQSLVGEDQMRDFMTSYLTKFSYQSITTPTWLEYFQTFFVGNQAIANVDWDTWLYATGMPPVNNTYDTSLADVAHNLSQSWLQNGAQGHGPNDIQGWIAAQKMIFLDDLVLQANPSNFPVSSLTAMKQFYQFQNDNDEVKFRWFKLSVSLNWKDEWADATAFMTQVGRMKFCVPIYGAFYALGDEGKQHAITTYENNKSFYHPICRKAIEAVLHL